MNLNNIDIKLAARNNPQAVNLGFVTARRYFIPLALAGGLAMLPILLLACLITYFYEGFFWASLLLWWAKPYVDRVILLNASRLLFREPIGLTEVLASMMQALKSGLWLNLTFYRFSLRRGLTLPIFVLEKTNGRNYTARSKIISRGSGSAASALTIGLLHVDWVLYLNAFLLMLTVLPDSTLQQVGDSINYLNFLTGHDGLAGLEWLLWTLLPIQALCTVIVEVFYVMSGFMLYLNSRIRTEGWHIELAFKQMAQRLNGLTRTALSICLIACGLGLGTITSTAQAETVHHVPEHVRLNPDDDKAILKDLLLADDTNPYRIQGQWKPKKPHQPESDTPDFDLNRLPNFAPLVKIILIFGALILLLWLMAHRERFMALWQSKPPSVDIDQPTIMFGLDIRRESLPTDISGEAARALASGDSLTALSLLYRGSLAALIHDHAVTIKESDTEGDCLRRSRPRLQTQTFHYLQSLTQAWQTTVYAHRQLPDSQVETLIQQWRDAFGGKV